MVMLVWWILSLFGVCSFGWLPVMIDAIIAVIVSVVFLTNNESDDLKLYVPISVIGVAIYAFCAQFLSLSLPFWCVFISPIWFILALFFPGGFTITNLVLNIIGVISVPMWVFVVGGLADALMLIAIIVITVKTYKGK